MIPSVSFPVVRGERDPYKFAISFHSQSQHSRQPSSSKWDLAFVEHLLVTAPWLFFATTCEVSLRITIMNKDTNVPFKSTQPAQGCRAKTAT